MKRNTSLYLEMTFAITYLHMPYELYLERTSEEMRLLNLRWLALHMSKEEFAMLPQDEQFFYLSAQGEGQRITRSVTDLRPTHGRT